MWHMGYICRSSQGEKRLLQKGFVRPGQEEFLIFDVTPLLRDEFSRDLEGQAAGLAEL
jgi:hypothetical protein